MLKASLKMCTRVQRRESSNIRTLMGWKNGAEGGFLLLLCIDPLIIIVRLP